MEFSKKEIHHRKCYSTTYYFSEIIWWAGDRLMQLRKKLGEIIVPCHSLHGKKGQPSPSRFPLQPSESDGCELQEVARGFDRTIAPVTLKPMRLAFRAALMQHVDGQKC